ncbi:MAG: hypothetical protein AB7V08_07785 [Elusimicrobiales bacterium]
MLQDYGYWLFFALVFLPVTVPLSFGLVYLDRFRRTRDRKALRRGVLLALIVPGLLIAGMYGYVRWDQYRIERESVY